MAISMSKSRAYIIVMTTFIVHLVSFGFEVIVGVVDVVRIHLTRVFHRSGHFARFRTTTSEFRCCCCKLIFRE